MFNLCRVSREGCNTEKPDIASHREQLLFKYFAGSVTQETRSYDLSTVKLEKNASSFDSRIPHLNKAMLPRELSKVLNLESQNFVSKSLNFPK